MKKVLIGILVAVAVLVVGGIVTTKVAERKLHKALADIPGAQIDFRKASLSPILGNLEFRDIKITLKDSTNTGPDVQGSIDAIKLEQLSWRRLMKGEAHAKSLVIRGPMAQLVLPPAKPAEEKTAEEKTAEVKKDSTAQSAQDFFLKKVSLDELKIEKAKIGLRGQGDSLKVAAQDIAFSVRDISFLLADNSIGYNDSSYRFSLDSLDYIDAPGLNRIKVGHLATKDAGPIEGLDMHIYNCVPMEEVAVRMGKVAAMWYDVKLDSLYTSAINIPRLVKDQRVNIESVHLSSPEIVIFQDDRYPPAVPYPTFQEGLNTLQMPLHIQQIDANIKLFTFIWETTHINRGTFPLHNVRLAVKSASNAQDNVMDMSIRSGDKTHGTLNLSFSTRNDKQETTRGKMLIKGLDASRLDPFVRPLFGATAKANIHQIDCTFKGNKHKMTEDFCMQYDNLAVQARDDANAPFKIVAKNSGVINFLANLVVPKSNPATPGKDPKRVEATFERNVMTPYPAYLIQNLTTGMLKTVLPGGAVHKGNNKDTKKK